MPCCPLPHFPPLHPSQRVLVSGPTTLPWPLFLRLLEGKENKIPFNPHYNLSLQEHKNN